MSSFEPENSAIERWLAGRRSMGITRPHSGRQVAAQQATIPTDYTMARMAAEQFYDRLRQKGAHHRMINAACLAGTPESRAAGQGLESVQYRRPDPGLSGQSVRGL
jgi:isocitrate lyase